MTDCVAGQKVTTCPSRAAERDAIPRQIRNATTNTAVRPSGASWCSPGSSSGNTPGTAAAITAIPSIVRRTARCRVRSPATFAYTLVVVQTLQIA
ncbi:hypothetical protein HDA39_003651 [Kribbella italica]|uniref:Uncharacterized protein n=1 Tax=Kribbella italica TaxID=1540520 RepID=A0A7W9J787_9ACTN|nr:hypothetical protein [Kribbella italica]MBB5836917.1 hypothetical protein [Kribbella italica]